MRAFAHLRQPGFCWLLIACGWLLGVERVSAQGEAESLSARFRTAAKLVRPAVVTVRSARESVPPAQLDQVGRFVPSTRKAGGSGVVIDAENGLVLTNDHVVEDGLRDGGRLVVTLPDGRERSVEEIRRDSQSDLALLAIDPEGLAQAAWGDSDALEIGDWVLAIGQPFGLSGTVTAGIVSGMSRAVGLANYEDLIQTDAAINPGNSGGPLINLDGDIVGINTAIKTINGGYEGVGFAVPARRAHRVARDLAEHGKVRRAYIGLGIDRLDPETAHRIEQPGALIVTSVASGGPAERAGVRPGDWILSLDGQAVEGLNMLMSVIEFAPVGEPLRLALLRGGQGFDVEVRPEPRPEVSEPFALSQLPTPTGRGRIASSPSPAPTSAPPRVGGARAPTRFPELGLRLDEPSKALIERFRLDPKVEGLVVVGVEPGGPADRGGLEPGMVVTDLSDQQIETLADLRAALANRPEGQPLILRVLKGRKPEFRVLLGVPNPRTGPNP